MKPLLVLTNKIDLGENLCKDSSYLPVIRNRLRKIVPTSALTEEGIYDGFDWMT
jgi:hypothetical protein